jgi:hypothetical protein
MYVHTDPLSSLLRRELVDLHQMARLVCQKVPTSSSRWLPSTRVVALACLGAEQANT